MNVTGTITAGSTLSYFNPRWLNQQLTAFAAAYPTVSNVGGQWSGALNNSGDTVILRAADGTEIERVTYTDLAPWPTAADGEGYSLVRISGAAPADSASNWRVSALPGGTPGKTDVQSPGSWFAAHGGGGALDDLNGDGTETVIVRLPGTNSARFARIRLSTPCRFRGGANP